MASSPISFVSVLPTYAERTLAVTDDGRRFSYGAVLALAVELAAAHRRLVFCLCANDPGSLLGYLALLKAAAVPAMLSGTIEPEKLRALTETYQPAFFWLPTDRLGDVPGSELVAQALDYSLVATGRGTDVAVHDRLALLLGTSGSTGSPMFVRQSQDNLSANAEAIAAYLDITANERPITTLPFHYTYGLSIVHSHVLRGCTLALTGKTFFERGFWDFLKSVQATGFGGVPYHYEMLKKLRFTRMALPSLRTLTQAGGRMDPALTMEFAQHCRDRGMRFFTMYGQAEATARISYLPPERAVAKAGSIGQAIPGGELWLEDEHGNRLDTADAVGELVFRGRNVTLGYAQGHADLALGDTRHGVLRTGDLARRDSDGDYYIVGRLKRFLKLFGHRVNLQDVEDDLNARGYAVACGGEDDHLVAYLPDGTAESAQAIKSRIVTLLGVNPVAVSVHGIAALPRNEAGKVRYAQLPHLIKGEPLA